MAQLNIRVDPDFLERLDDWRREQPDLPNRPEAARRLISNVLDIKKSAVNASPDRMTKKSTGQSI